MTLLPRSRRCLSVSSRRSLSRWCRPIDGSSSTYITPVSPDPICEARRMRCASPPESVSAELELGKERAGFLQRPVADLEDRALVAGRADLDMARLAAQARAVAFRARLGVQILGQLLAH